MSGPPYVDMNAHVGTPSEMVTGNSSLQSSTGKLSGPIPREVIW